MENIQDSNNSNNFSQIEYAYLKTKEISKKVWTWWDIFLFFFVYSCAFVFFVGFVLFIFGGIGIYSADTDNFMSTGKAFPNWNGFWFVNPFLNSVDSSYSSIIYGDNPSDAQKFIDLSKTMKQLYDIGMYMWIISLSIMSCFTVVVVIIYFLWKKGYFNIIGKYIFDKIQHFQEKIDNYGSDKTAKPGTSPPTI